MSVVALVIAPSIATSLHNQEISEDVQVMQIEAETIQEPHFSSLITDFEFGEETNIIKEMRVESLDCNYNQISGELCTSILNYTNKVYNSRILSSM